MASGRAQARLRGTRHMTMTPNASVDLSSFSNAWYVPGRHFAVRVAWLLVCRMFFQSALPWPYWWKINLLRAFGATIGHDVVLKPRINIKYPWHLSIGDNSWIGEGVWLDSLARIEIGSNVCLSQDVMVETGNHDWSKPSFDLVVREVVIEDGAWAAVRSLLLPGSRLSSHAVLAAGAVLAGASEPYGIYTGNPAVRTRERRIAIG
jgi:putative colanic acid biosynthesis acetyltransferase WcaF